MRKPSVLVSILNWNNAKETLGCISSLADEISTADLSVELRVIDNGSRPEEYLELKAGAEQAGVAITRLDENLGFTGGHNTSIDLAITKCFDYVWLLNNDAKVEPGCLRRLVMALEKKATLGAVSPVIKPEGDSEPVAAWGGLHEMSTRATVWFSSEAESIKAHMERPDDVFVAGTAILIRTAALKQVGQLDDRLFAYYDDSDIGVRLAKGGWRSEVVFDAAISHKWRSFDQLPNHVIYLLYRNQMIFWYTHLPTENRLVLRLKLVNQAIYDATRLSSRGYKSQSDAALLGVWDFFFNNFGKPNLERQVPAVLNWACKFSAFVHKVRLQQYEDALMSEQA